MKDITVADTYDNIPLVSKAKAWTDEFLFISGPCTVENYEQLHAIASILKRDGIDYLRGGAYKPLTFPYRNDKMFELREEGLEILEEVASELDMWIVSEIVDVRLVERLANQGPIDIIQIGSRNMYNYPLLEECAETGKPILLKRHFGASLRDWLGAAEYILNKNNSKVILCERGIAVPHTHSEDARFIGDIQVIPCVKKKTGIPVIFDPSHSTFNRDIVPHMSRAAVAAGADGLIIESHITPEKAAVDRLNAINVVDVGNLRNDLLNLRQLINDSRYNRTERDTRTIYEEAFLRSSECYNI